MKIRNYEKLTLNLPQLQDRIKRDKDSYRNEFLIQLEHFYSMMEMFKLNPSTNLKNFAQMISFMAHVANCYVDDLKKFPDDLKSVLKSYSTVIHPEIRFAICKALILLRNKSLLSPTDLLTTFFELFSCQDKLLREFLKSHIINDIKNLNLKERNFKQNNLIQSFIFNKLKESNVTSGKVAIDIMGQLFKKNVWHDARTVNKIAECCFSKHTKLLVTALSFFTGSTEKDEDDDEKKNDSESESEPEDKNKIVKKVLNQNKVNKKTRRRQKLLERTTKAINQDKKKHKGQTFNFSALHLIYDPQDLADRLLRQLEKSTERYEVKLMMMDVISRLIGVHQLMVLNFYSFIQRYLQPHQKDITKILLYVSQASHELVLPDVMENIVKHIAFNFITERNSPECMAVGLNTVREICIRCPLAISSELLQDFADYKSYKNKNVAMAAKALIQYYRITNPDMLKNKDRGRKTIAVTELKVKEFGESGAVDYLPGAELLEQVATDESDVDLSDLEEENNEMEEDSAIENDISDEEMEDESMDDEESQNEEENRPTTSLTADQTDKKLSQSALKKKSSFRRSKMVKEDVKSTKEISQEMAREKANELCSTRILDQNDFDKLKSIRIAKQVRAAKSANTKRKSELHLLEDDLLQRKELVSLSSIERLYKRPKLSKEERDNEAKGRHKLGRGEWRQNEKASKTEKERQRNKAFMMIKHKVKRKKKQSFKSKQLKVKSALLKQLKAKKL